MSERSGYQFVVTMDVDPEKEPLFNDIYDNEHIPHLMKVPGMRSATRLVGMPGQLGTKTFGAPDLRYMAIFDIDHPDVLITPTHGNAVEAGRWANEVRPFTINRTHRLYKVISRF